MPMRFYCWLVMHERGKADHGFSGAEESRSILSDYFDYFY